MAKIRVHRDEAIDQVYPAKVVMRVAATSIAGRRHEIEIADPRGHARNPMDDGEIADKFKRLAEPVLGTARSEAALAALWNAEREPAAGRLLDLIEIEGG
jgi:2-methylcitrate dehydratase